MKKSLLLIFFLIIFTACSTKKDEQEQFKDAIRNAPISDDLRGNNVEELDESLIVEPDE